MRPVTLPSWSSALFPVPFAVATLLAAWVAGELLQVLAAFVVVGVVMAWSMARITRRAHRRSMVTYPDARVVSVSVVQEVRPALEPRRRALPAGHRAITAAVAQDV